MRQKVGRLMVSVASHNDWTLCNGHLHAGSPTGSGAAQPVRMDQQSLRARRVVYAVRAQVAFQAQWKEALVNAEQ